MVDRTQRPSSALLEARLTAALGRPVAVQLGHSRRTPVQMRADTEATLRLRVHEFFADAPETIANALAAWLRNGRRARAACLELDNWIAEQLEALPPRPPRNPAAAQPIGTCFDLESLRDVVIGTYLPQLASAPPTVTWGRRVRSRGRQSLQLGSFHPATRCIRIHPVLDHESVPQFFLEFVLFHELLHAALPAERTAGGRLQHHSPEFLTAEAQHPDYQRAMAFERSELCNLIRRARRGTAD